MLALTNEAKSFECQNGYQHLDCIIQRTLVGYIKL